MMKRRASQQYLAMQGDRLLGRSFLPGGSVAGADRACEPALAGKAAPGVTPPAFGAATHFNADGDLAAVPQFERAGRTRVWSGDP